MTRVMTRVMTPTADTITDDDLRRLERELAEEGDFTMARYASRARCRTMRYALARCADLANERWGR